MQKEDKENINSPKTKKDEEIDKKKRKIAKDDRDEEDGDLNRLELQKYIQKIFPSKSNSEKIRQMEKIDKLINKKNKSNKKSKKVADKNKSNKKIKKQKTKKTTKEEFTDEDSSSDYKPEEDSEFEEYEEDYYEDEYAYYEDDDYMDDIDSDEYDEILNNNMKFNIIFTVGGYEDENYDDLYYDEEYKSTSEDEFTNSESDDNEQNIKLVKKEKNKSSSRKSKSRKSESDKEFEKQIYKEEERMKKKVKSKKSKQKLSNKETESFTKKKNKKRDTKFIKNDNVSVKLPNWDDFYEGVIVNVNKHRKKSLTTYDIQLNDDKDGSEYELLKKVKSKYIVMIDKSENEIDEVMKDIKEYVKCKKKEGKKGLFKKFDKILDTNKKLKEKEKDENEKKKKGKNLSQLRKLLKSKNVMNDFKYFKEMDLNNQKKILKQLKLVNKFSNVEKPYRLALLESNIPVEFKAHALKKINCLNYMDPGSGEYYKIKQWVDTFMRIPFGVTKNLPLTINDGIDKCNDFMENAKEILDKSVYGLEDAKTQILQMVGQWISNPNAIGTAIAIKGPMGTGKTTLIKEGISKILNRPFSFIALGGATDSSFLEGHSYTYEGSMWGKIVDIIINKKCMNPVFYFDELDKVSNTPKGEEIIGILTHLTDTSQNSEFHDKYF